MAFNKNHCDKGECERQDLRAEIARLRAALEFYARPIAYEGSNSRNVGQDPFTPLDRPYIQDVSRDNGEVARAALNPQSE